MLSVENLSFRYPKAKETLYGGLNHRFTPGVITAVTGPSGCGKSTLLYVLGLMLRPTGGSVRLDDRVLSDARASVRAAARARSFGFVFQDSALDATRTILDSVIEPALYAGLSRREASKRALELMELTGVDYRASHKPGEISGGQAQRVALARALVNNPQVVLADEPTGNLDTDNADNVLRIFRSEAEMGRTIIVVTHDREVVERADEVVALR